MAFPKSSFPCLDSTDVEEVLYRLELESAVNTALELEDFAATATSKFCQRGSATTSTRRCHDELCSHLRLTNYGSEVDNVESFSSKNSTFDIEVPSLAESNQLWALSSPISPPSPRSSAAAARPSLMTVRQHLKNEKSSLSEHPGLQNYPGSSGIGSRRSIRDPAISSSSEYEPTSPSSEESAWSSPTSFDSDGLMFSYRPPNVCKKHLRTKVTRLRPLHSLATGRRKFRCETCTSILLRWVKEQGATATGHRRAQLLSMVGLNGSQLDNWLTNKRRAQRRERSRRECVTISNRS